MHENYYIHVSSNADHSFIIWSYDIFFYFLDVRSHINVYYPHGTVLFIYIWTAVALSALLIPHWCHKIIAGFIVIFFINLSSDIFDR